MNLDGLSIEKVRSLPKLDLVCFPNLLGVEILIRNLLKALKQEKFSNYLILTIQSYSTIQVHLSYMEQH